MNNTEGHVAAVTGVQWHPLDDKVMLTSSIDGSIRTWRLDGKLHFDELTCSQVRQRVAMVASGTHCHYCQLNLFSTLAPFT